MASDPTAVEAGGAVKDPLQAEKTAYEILGLEHGAGDAAIELAFKKAIAEAGATGQDPGRLVQARNALKRPAERARQDLLRYAASAAPLSPSPLSDPGCLLPDRRAETAAAWEAHLREKYPEMVAAHSLAVLWYWWSLYQEAELRRAVESGGPSADPAGALSRTEPLGHPMLLAAWRRTIAYLTMLANTPGFWRSCPGLEGDLVKEVMHALVRSLGDRFHQSEQLFKQLGCSDLANGYAQLKLDLSRETSTAAVWVKADPCREFPEVETPCGPLLLQQLGRLGRVQARLRSASGEESRLLRELLSDLWQVYMALRDKAPDAALDAIARLPPGQCTSTEVSRLRARALLLKGQEQASLDDFEGALRSWEAGLGSAGDEDIGGEIRSAIVKTCRAQANALGTPGRDDAIALLGRAVALVHDSGLTQTLSLLLLERGIQRINRYLERKGRGEDLAEGEAQSVRDAAEGISRAATLDPSSSRTAEQAETAKEIVRGLALAECASRNPRLKAILSQVERATQKGQFDDAIGLLEEALRLGIDEAQSGLRQRLAACLNSRAVKNTNEAGEVLSRPTPSYLRAASSFADSLPSGFIQCCAVCSTIIGSSSYTWRRGNQVALLCPACASMAQAEEAELKAAASKLLLDALADLRDAVELDPQSQSVKENKRQLEHMLSELDIPAVSRRPRRYAQYRQTAGPPPAARAPAHPAVAGEVVKVEAATEGRVTQGAGRESPRARPALGLLCLVLMPLLLVVGSVAWTASRTVLRPPFYAQALAEAGILESLPKLVSPDLADFFWGGKVPAKSRPQFEQLIADALAAALPPPWIGPKLTEIATAALDHLRGSDSSFQFVLDVIEPKSKAMSVLSKSKLAWDLVRRVRTPVSRLPVQFKVTADTQPALQARLDQARALVRILDLALPLGAGFAGLICLLSLLVAGGVRQGGLGWLGGGLLIGGLAVLGLAAGFRYEAPFTVASLPLDEVTVPLAIREALGALSGAVVACLRQAGFVLLLGAATLYVLGWMVRSPSSGVPAAAADRAPAQSRPAEALPRGAGASMPATGQPGASEAQGVKVTDACIRCGACVAACPELFIMGEDRAHVKEWVLKKALRTGDKSLHPRIREAVEVCPIDAIVLG